MGLRHRTPISALREQRRSADRQAGSAHAELTPPKTLLNRRRLALEALSTGTLVPEALPTVEKDLALVLRLRSCLALARRSEGEVRNACESLEDEIRRLGQMQAARPGSERRPPEDLHIAPQLYATPDHEDLPYRSLKIVAPPRDAQPNLQRLDLAPSDLKAYYAQATKLERPEAPRPLSLVSARSESPGPGEEVSQASSEAGPSAAAAAFVQQSLKPADADTAEQRLSPKVVLSLLDT